MSFLFKELQVSGRFTPGDMKMRPLLFVLFVHLITDTLPFLLDSLPGIDTLHVHNRHSLSFAM